MQPKYTSGQRVEIVSVKDEHLNPKYPEMEKYVGESASVVDSYWVGLEGRSLPRDFFIYILYIDRTNTEISVEEDAIREVS